MKILRRVAAVVLVLIAILALGANICAPAAYDRQFREFPNQSPGRTFPLGTDELGRDRFSRLLYGAQVSLLLAPAAAALTVLVALAVGLPAGLYGGFADRAATAVIDLFLCLPWFFVLLAARAVLPLNTGPWTSVTITFLLLGLLGWASGARVVRSGTRSLLASDSAMQARATGSSTVRLALVHLLPQLRPLVVSQFWLAIPAFLLAEANLGMLGLGVAEPMPSLGNSLAELSNLHSVAAAPWMLAPAALLLVVLTCLHLLLSQSNRISIEGATR